MRPIKIICPKPTAVIRRGITTACALVAGSILAASEVSSIAAPALLPRPAHSSYTGQQLAIADGVPVVVPAASSARVLEIAEVLREELRLRFGLAAKIVPGGVPAAGAILLTLVATDHPAGAESYELHVAQNAEVRANDPRGLLWGVQTLLQGIELSGGSSALPCGVVTDRPARPWRAVMLDPARSFLQIDFLHRMIRAMSAYKFNVLHLHLIDDQAWRFETRSFPKCNPPGEPFYTQDELRALVAFAARYGVEIVPEFDFPGHSRAAIAAYPDLDCENQVRAENDAILCGGKVFTLEFIEKIVAEAASVFPSRFLHLGADEPFALKRWGDCPHCRQRMKEKGVSTLEAFYHTFVLDLNGIVRRHGRQMIVWNDAFHPGVEPAPSKDIIIDAWLGYENAQAWATGGYTIINSSTGPLYLTSLGLLGGVPLPAVHGWNATLFASPSPKRGAQAVQYRALSSNATLLGGQACAWATEQGLVERRLFPRLLSVAETLWTEDRKGDLADLESRLRTSHERQLRLFGVPADDSLAEETLYDGRGTAAWIAVGAPAFAPADGELVSTGGPDRGWLRSRETYRDFTLAFELWSGTTTDATGVVYACNATAPEGRSISAKPPRGFAEAKGNSPAKRWNRYEFTVRSGIATLTVNDRFVWSQPTAVPIEGAIGLVGGEGLKYRAIRIRRLPAKGIP